MNSVDKNKHRHWWRWVWIPLASLLLIYFVVLVIWHFSFSSKSIQDMLEKFATEELAARVSVDEASLNLFPMPSINLKKLQIYPQKGLPLSADEVTIDLAFLPLLWGQIQPTSLRLQKPQLPVFMDDQGRFSLGGFLPNYSASKPFKYNGHVQVKDANLSFATLAGGNHFSVESADYDGDLDLNSEKATVMDGSLKLHNITGFDQNTQKPRFDNLDLAFKGKINLSEDGSGWQISQGKIWLGRAELGLEASSRGSANSNTPTELHISGNNIDLEEVFSVLPEALLPQKKDLTVRGTVQVDLLWVLQPNSFHESDPKKTDEITGSIEFADVECGITSEKDRAGSINGKLLFSTSGLEFSGISGITAGKSFTVSGKLNGLKNPLWDVQIQGRMPLGIIAKILGVAPDWRVEGNADVDVAISGNTATPAGLSFTGRLAPQDASVTTPFLTKPFTGISGEIKLEGSSLGTNLVARLGDGNLSLSGTVSDWTEPAIVFSVNADKLDLDAALAKPDKNKAVSTSIPSKDNTNASCEVTIASCKLLGIAAENVHLTGNYKQGSFDLQKLTAQGYGGNLILRGKIDLTKTEPEYQLTADIADVEINRYLSQETDVKDSVTGRFGAHFNFSASGTNPASVKKTLQADGTATLKQGRIKELAPLVKLALWSGLELYRDLPVDSIKTNFHISGEKITLKSTQEQGPSVDINLDGTVGLDLTLNLKVSNLFSLQYSQNIFGTNKTIQLVRDIRGRGVLAFLVTGAAKDPDFRLDPKTMGKDALGMDKTNPTIEGSTSGDNTKPDKNPDEGTPNPRKWF